MNISVIGLGKLGLPMCAVFASKGHFVLGIDNSPKAVKAAQKGVPQIPEQGVKTLLAEYPVAFSTSYERLSKTDITFIIVPTPTDKEEEGFSNQYVLTAIRDVGKQLREKQEYHLVVIVSTVMPGSMKQIQTELEQTAKKPCGEHLGLCYSPEFIALGTVIRDMQYPDILLIGERDKKAGQHLTGFLRTISPDAAVHRMNFQEAEITKLCLNVALCSRIALANLIGRFLHQTGNKPGVASAAIGDDHRIGHAYMKPGAPVGGPCLPRDTKALTVALKKYGIDSSLPDTLTQETYSFISYLVQDFQKYLLPEQTVAILGWSYKPGTPIVEDSAAPKLAAILLRAGFKVIGHDPQAKIDFPSVTVMKSVDSCLEQAQGVFVHTPWPEYKEIKHEQLRGKHVIDFWNITGE